MFVEIPGSNIGSRAVTVNCNTKQHIATTQNKWSLICKMLGVFRTAISLLASQFAKRPALRESATNDCQYQTWVSKVHRTTHQKTRPKTKDQAPCGSSIRERSTHQQCTVMVPWQNANHYASKHTKRFVPKVGANRLQHVICTEAMYCNIRIALLFQYSNNRGQ